MHLQDLTAAQLRSLHIAGRPGLHAPTLSEFLSAFRSAGCRRPMVIEIKRIASDKGRQRLLDLLRCAAVCFDGSCCLAADGYAGLCL